MNSEQLPAWKTRERTVILNQPPWLVVESHTVELPDGRVIADWPWVITPDYVNVVALTERGTFLCFRQVKYGLTGDTLSIVGGHIEPEETPLEAAKRELREQTGYVAEAWTRLGCYRVDPNRGMAMGHLFLARQLRWTAQPTSDDLEEQHLLELDRRALEAALDRGGFQVMAWTTAIALALREIDRRE